MIKRSIALGAALLVAVIVGSPALAQDEPPGEESAAVMSKECVAFSQDEFANVGVVLAAGCKPSTAQMSPSAKNISAR